MHSNIIFDPLKAINVVYTNKKKTSPHNRNKYIPSMRQLDFDSNKSTVQILEMTSAAQKTISYTCLYLTLHVRVASETQNDSVF